MDALSVTRNSSEYNLTAQQEEDMAKLGMSLGPIRSLFEHIKQNPLQSKFVSYKTSGLANSYTFLCNKVYVHPPKKIVLGKGQYKTAKEVWDLLEKRSCVRLTQTYELGLRFLKKLEATRQEIYLHTLFQNSQYIAKIFKGMICYSKLKSVDGCPTLMGKIIFFMPKYGTLENQINWGKKRKEPIGKESILYHKCLQLAMGLKTMHDEGVAHIDLKPQNVFFSIDPHIPGQINYCLADLGLSNYSQNIQLKNPPGSPLRMSCHYYSSIKRENRLKLLSLVLPRQKAIQTMLFENDRYALALIFYECLEQALPEWLQCPTTKEQKLVLANLTRAAQQLHKFPEPADKFSFRHLIWEMLNPDDPSQRPPMEEIIARLEALESQAIRKERWTAFKQTVAAGAKFAAEHLTLM